MKLLMALSFLITLPLFADSIKCDLHKDGAQVFMQEGDEIVTPKFTNRDGTTIYFYATPGHMYYATENKIAHREFSDGGHFMITTYSWETYFFWCGPAKK